MGKLERHFFLDVSPPGISLPVLCTGAGVIPKFSSVHKITLREIYLSGFNLSLNKQILSFLTGLIGCFSGWFQKKPIKPG